MCKRRDTPVKGGTHPILFRDERVQGTLHRLTLTLLAEEGEDMQLDVTAFVPDASYENVPDLPSILGLHGCLERARFAFDPATDTFYFGPASPAADAWRRMWRHAPCGACLRLAVI